MKKFIIMLFVVVVLSLTVTADNAARKEWHRSFVYACTESASINACNCTADILLAAYPGDEILYFSIRLMNGTATSGDKATFNNAIRICSGK